MRKHRILLSLVIAFCLTLGAGGTALAASYTGDDVVPGLTGIQPGDTITMPEDTEWATLTAQWGVRVTYVDWDQTELKSEVIPEQQQVAAPADPAREGYTFTGWLRTDGNAGAAILADDGSVSNVTGPGPIVLTAQYEPVGGNADPDDPSPALPRTGDQMGTVFLAVAAVALILAIALIAAGVSSRRKTE